MAQVDSAQKDALIRPHLAEREVTVEGVGVFRVRQLAHGDVLDLQDAAKRGTASREVEAQFLAKALVDPTLTEQEAATWVANAPSDEVAPVVDAVLEMAGLRGGPSPTTFRP